MGCDLARCMAGTDLAAKLVSLTLAPCVRSCTDRYANAGSKRQADRDSPATGQSTYGQAEPGSDCHANPSVLSGLAGTPLCAFPFRHHHLLMTA